MGQTTSSKLPADVRQRVDNFRLDEILCNEKFLQQATSATTQAFSRYRFEPYRARGQIEGGAAGELFCIGQVRFWHLDKVVDLKDATAVAEPEGSPPPLNILTPDAEGEQIWKAGENGKLTIQFEMPTPVSEFAFQTCASAAPEQDPICFRLSGSVDGEKWLLLCDQKDTPFPTPEERGVWTRRMELQDESVKTQEAGAKAAKELQEAMENRGCNMLQAWLAGSTHKPPVDEVSKFVACCRAQIVGESYRRREALFDMMYGASIAQAAEEEEAAAAAGADDVASGSVAGLTARLGVRLMLETGLRGPMAGAVLDMLDAEISAGVANLNLPPKEEDMPRPLEMGMAAASEAFADALLVPEGPGAPAQGGAPARFGGGADLGPLGPKVAAIMLRVATLRGSFKDAFIVVRWLLMAKPAGDLSCMWPAVEALFAVHAPWVLQPWCTKFEDWAKEDGQERSHVRAMGSFIKEVPKQGIYAEVKLECAGAKNCEVMLISAGKPSDANSTLSLLKGTPDAPADSAAAPAGSAVRPLRKGDVVGVHLFKGEKAVITVNGHDRGHVDWNPAVDVVFDKGGFYLAVQTNSKIGISINVGQQPFAFEKPEAAVAWGVAAGLLFWEDLRKSATANLAADGEAVCLASAIMGTFERNGSGLDKGGSSSKLVIETPHPYENNMRRRDIIQIKGAKKLKLSFDKRSRTEENCDVLTFWSDEQCTKAIRQCTGTSPTRWTEFEYEGDTMWFTFNTDGSRVDWGFRCTIEATVVNQKMPLIAESGAVPMIVSTLKSAAVPEAGRMSLLRILKTHLLFCSCDPTIGLEVSDYLLAGARQKGPVALLSATVFGDTCSRLMSEPMQLLRMQVQVLTTRAEYTTEVLDVITHGLASAEMFLGQITDIPEAPDLLVQLIAILKVDPTSSAVAKVLWKALRDAVSYLISGRSDKPTAGWGVVLRTARTVFAMGVEFCKSGEKSRQVLGSLLLPMLQGLSVVPSFSVAEWDDVVDLLPSLGLLLQCPGETPLLKSIRSAACALLVKLGCEMVELGVELPEKDEGLKKKQDVLYSPLLRALPRRLLGAGYTGAPSGVSHVEMVTGVGLQDPEAEKKLMEPVLDEIVSASTDRAKALLKTMGDPEFSDKPGPTHFPPRVHRLIFCVLLARYRAVETVKVAMETIQDNQVLSGKALTQIWSQAQKIGFPWLLSIKQRMAATGREPKFIVQVMEQALEMLAHCEVPEYATDLDEDEDHLTALWEQQGHGGRGGDGSISLGSTFGGRSSWGNISHHMKAVKRLNLLLKQAPTNGKSSPAVQIKAFFESPWLSDEDPIGFLTKQIVSSSLKTWRRAAGINLLTWALTHCTAGADDWVTGQVLNNIHVALKKESGVNAKCAEISAIAAMNVARRSAILELTKFLQAAGEDRKNGFELQTMALAGLAGPWRPSDHQIIVHSGVLQAIAPYLPWVAKHPYTCMQRGRAAWLALEALIGTIPMGAAAQADAGNESSHILRLAREILAELLGALPDLVKTKGAKGDTTKADAASASLANLFGMDYQPDPQASVDIPKFVSATTLVEDLRKRLQAGEDFGEFPKEKWEPWLTAVSKFMQDFGETTGRKSVKSLGGEAKDYDVDGDGMLDVYELIRYMSFSDHSAENKEDFPQVFPESLPKHVGHRTASFLDALPRPGFIDSKTCAFLLSLDHILRTPLALTAFKVISTSTHFDALVSLTSGSMPVSLFALHTFRVCASSLSSSQIEQVVRTLLEFIAADGESPLEVRGNRAVALQQAADVLQAWLASGGVAEKATQQALRNAFASDSEKMQAAALYVVATPPQMQPLGAALVGGESPCRIIDVAPPGDSWEFVPFMDSPGNDLSSVGAQSIEKMKEMTMGQGGIAFNTAGWIKHTVNYPLSRFSEDPAAGLYILKRRTAPVKVICEGSSTMDVVLPSKAVPQASECKASSLGVENLQLIVGMAPSMQKHQAWALRAALKDTTAVKAFLARGFLDSWFGVARRIRGMRLTMELSSQERCGLASMMRAEFPTEWKEVTKALKDQEVAAAAPAEAGDADAAALSATLMGGLAGEDIKAAGTAAVALASRLLGASPTAAGKDIPLLAELLVTAKEILSKPSDGRILRVAGLLKPAQPADPTAANRCGLTNSPAVATLNAAQQQLNEFMGPPPAQDKIMETIRKAKSKAKDYAKEAASWERHALAVDICLSCVLYLASNAASEEEVKKLDPVNLASLALSFQECLQDDAMRKQARAAVMALAKKSPLVRDAIQALALANLLGGLGKEETKESTGGEVFWTDTTFESAHPYENNTNETRKFSFPGAKSIKIEFDASSITENNCDALKFSIDGGETPIDGQREIIRMGDPTWVDFEIPGDHFEYKWVTDGSCTRQGWIFTARPQGMPPKKEAPGEPADIKDGVWMTELMLDLVDAGSAQALLRPAFASLLLAHAEKKYDAKVFANLERFIKLSQEHKVALDWQAARHTLQAMMRSAQEGGEQAAVAANVGLRLLLSDVNVSKEVPYFKPCKGVQLMGKSRDQVMARSQVDALCFVSTTAMSVNFKKTSDRVLWVGMAQENGPGVRMLRLSDAALLKDTEVEQPSEAVSADWNSEVRVVLNTAIPAVFFYLPGVTRNLLLPPGSTGWKFAVKLAELGSSVRVTLPNGATNSDLDSIRTTSAVLDAVTKGQSMDQWPDEFVAESFSTWMKAHRFVAELPTDIDLESLPDGALMAWGCGIEAANGVYKACPAAQNLEGRPTYTNADGWFIRHRDGQGWCLHETNTQEVPMFACVMEHGQDNGPQGPWFTLGDDAFTELAIAPPVISGKGGLVPCSFEKSFNPPLSLHDDKGEMVEGMKVHKIIQASFVTAVMFTEEGQDFDNAFNLLARCGDQDPVMLSRSFRRWGKVCCASTPSSDQVTALDSTMDLIYERGTDAKQTVRFHLGEPSGSLANLEAFAEDKGFVVESEHPLADASNKKLNVSVTDASKMCLQFDPKCQLPPDSVVLITTDEAGLQPLTLERLPSREVLAASAKYRADSDASRGIISLVRGEQYKVDASNCFLHFPAPRPVQWDPTVKFAPEPVFMVTPHPYDEGASCQRKVALPGARKIKITFSPQCETEEGIDIFCVFKDEQLTEMVTMYTGKKGGEMWKDLELEQGHFWYTFMVCSAGKRFWGYEFTVTDAEAKDSTESEKLEASSQMFKDGVHLGGDGALLFEGASASDEYLVRSSVAAVTTLRPGLLGGEISIDFTGAQPSEGDIVVGLVAAPPSTLSWPANQPPTPTAQEAPAEPAAQPAEGEAPPPAEGEQPAAPAAAPEGAPAEAAPAEAAPAAPAPEEAPAPISEMEPRFWWRCDGASWMPTSEYSQSANEDKAFGAGDILSFVAEVAGNKILAVRLMRNGEEIGVLECNGNAVIPEDAAGAGLSLCVAMRKSSSCISLVSSPKLVNLTSGKFDEAELPTLAKQEVVLASAIFKGLDASGDGLLSKDEISHALGGSREQLFLDLDVDNDSHVSLEEWHVYCTKVKATQGADGLHMFLDAFRKKLAYIGRAVAMPGASEKPATAWGLKVRVVPSALTSTGLLEEAKKKAAEKYAEFERLACNDWTEDDDTTLLSVLEWQAEQCVPAPSNPPGQVANLENLEWRMLRDKRKERKQAFPTFSMPDSRVLARLVVLKGLNRWVETRLDPFWDLGTMRDNSFSGVISECRHILFNGLKYRKFNQVLEETFTNNECVLNLSRQLQIDCKAADECDWGGKKMLFSQASLGQDNIGDQVFRSRGPNYNRPIAIKYLDEGGIDQGGLYRDFIDACAMELMSLHLPILCPTPNTRDNKGDCREAWTLRPGKVTNATRRLLRMLGRLMGLCARRRDVLPLSLSSLTWKLLVAETPTLQDLSKADVNTAESISQMLNLQDLGVTADDFDMVFGQMFFEYQNSAGEKVVLCEGGETRQVTFENAREFAEAVQDMRFNEAKEQVAIIREAMSTVVPIGCFSLWTWQDLEHRVCGTPDIDLDLLKKHTIYESCTAEDSQVKFLWQALHNMAQADRRLFIRFVWGRSRLPADTSPMWGNGFKIAKAGDIGERGLPRAHTCFFQIDLPVYSSPESCTERVLFAIRNCMSMQNA